MRANPWLYHYYTAQSKLQFGLAYEPGALGEPPPPGGAPATAPLLAPPIISSTTTILPLRSPHIILQQTPQHLAHMGFTYERMDAGPVDYSVHTVDER